MSMANQLHIGNEQRARSLNEGSCEIGRNDKEKQFTSLVVDSLMDTLQINWNDRRIVSALLNTALTKVFTGSRRDGLLEQYLHTQLDIIAESKKREYELNNDIDVDYGHATHAKLNGIFNALMAINGEEKDQGA